MIYCYKLTGSFILCVKSSESYNVISQDKISKNIIHDLHFSKGKSISVESTSEFCESICNTETKKTELCLLSPLPSSNNSFNYSSVCS